MTAASGSSDRQLAASEVGPIFDWVNSLTPHEIRHELLFSLLLMSRDDRHERMTRARNYHDETRYGTG